MTKSPVMLRQEGDAAQCGPVGEGRYGRPTVNAR